MRERDVRDRAGVTRSEAVYDLLHGMLTQQLAKGFKSTDLYSLVEMRDDAEVVFERRGLGLGLVQSVVRRRDAAAPRSHGCYVPALEAVQRLALSDRSEAYGVCVLFISDGKPSDSTPPGRDDALTKLALMITEHVLDLERTFGASAAARLRVHTLGVGSEDFAVLDAMASCCASSCVGKFHRSQLQTSALRAVISSFSSSVMETRSSLLGGGSSSAAAGGAMLRPRRASDAGEQLQLYKCVNEWRFELSVGQSGDRRPRCISRTVDPQRRFAVVAPTPFASGAERNVYYCAFEAARSPAPPERSAFLAGRKFCVKESKFVESSDATFHQAGLMCQTVARVAAEQFTRLCAARGVAPAVRVEYVDAYLLRLEPIEGGPTRLVTVEPLLTLQPEQYTKWNSNAGGVRARTAISGQRGGGFARPSRFRPSSGLGGIMESFAEGDEEDEDEDDVINGRERGVSQRGARRGGPAASSRASTDVPQAFSHWTYCHSKGSSLVCDIQGVLRDAAAPLGGGAARRRGGGGDTYRLTDPVVCTRKGRVFGRTDRGMVGVQSFLSTHTCNSVCKALQLPIGSLDDECSICLDRMVLPKMLPCRHTFCRDCLDGLRRCGQSACPLCRARVGDSEMQRALLTTLVRQSERRGSRSAAVQREELDAMY